MMLKEKIFKKNDKWCKKQGRYLRLMGRKSGSAARDCIVPGPFWRVLELVEKWWSSV